MSDNNSKPIKMNNKPTLNRAARKKLAAQARRRKGSSRRDVPTSADQIATDVKVYTDDSYKDKAKIAYTHGLAEARERVKAINAKYELPQKIETLRAPFFRWLDRLRHWRGYTTALLVNRDGRRRDFLPDVPGDHRLLVHGSIARHLVSGVCMLVRITANEDKDGNPIDGSWAIVPAQYAMMRATTIQHLRRRPFFFLRRYWYEISFDGRVQPAHLLFDYNLNPAATHTRLYVTHEYVPIRNRDDENDYFRFWRKKPIKPINPTK